MTDGQITASSTGRSVRLTIARLPTRFLPTGWNVTGHVGWNRTRRRLVDHCRLACDPQSPRGRVVLVAEECTDDVVTANDLAGLPKGTRVLTLQNHVSLSNLSARAWDTLRTAVQSAAIPRAARPIRVGGSPATRDLAGWVDQDLPRMRRGAERC